MSGTVYSHGERQIQTKVTRPKFSDHVEVVNGKRIYY